MSEATPNSASVAPEVSDSNTTRNRAERPSVQSFVPGVVMLGACAALGAGIGASLDAKGEYAGVPYAAHVRPGNSYDIGLGINNGVTVPNKRLSPHIGASVQLGMPDSVRGLMDGLAQTQRPTSKQNEELNILAAVLAAPEAASIQIQEQILANIQKGASMGLLGGLSVIGLYGVYRRKPIGFKAATAVTASAGLLASGSIATSIHNSPTFSSEKSVITQLNGTTFQGAAIHGAPLRSAMDVLVPLVEREKDRTDTYSKKAINNFDVAVTNTPPPLPEENEITVFSISDFHTSVANDKPLTHIVKTLKPNLILNTGDMATGIDGLETWPITLLTDDLPKDIPHLFAAGNHDANKTIVAAKKAGMNVLSPDKPFEYKGVQFIGASDPKFDRYGHETRYRNNETLSSVGNKIADSACEASAQGRPVVVAAHEKPMVAQSIARGCAETAIYGHMHSYVTQVDESGRRFYQQGTSGGAKETVNLTVPKVPSDSSLLYIDKSTGKIVREYQITIAPSGDVVVTPTFLLPPQIPIQVPVSQKINE